MAFGLPPGQDEGAVLAGAAQHLLAALAAPQSDSALLIAWVEEAGQPDRRAGFLRLDTERPLFGSPFAYLADLALAEWAEGHGLGQLLLEQAEHWAREQGLKHIQLHVFATNARARKLYAAGRVQRGHPGTGQGPQTREVSAALCPAAWSR